MDYDLLVHELVDSMRTIHKHKIQKNANVFFCGEMEVLHFLSGNCNKVTPSEISQKTGVSTARIANALNSLEKKDFICREIYKSDRRKILVSLTDLGKNSSDAYKQEILNTTKQLLKLLGEKDASEYVRIMKKLAKIYKEFE